MMTEAWTLQIESGRIIMKTFERNPALRQGQFLWRDKDSQAEYVTRLKAKIANGFYFSDQVMGKIVDEMAPVFAEDVE